MDHRNQLRRDRRRDAPLDEPGRYGGRSVRQAKLDQEQRRHLKKYRISIEDRLRMTLERGGRCLICGRILEPAGHRKREVRGIRCYACNTGIGHFQDDPKLLGLAINYLQRSRRGQQG